MGAAEPLRQRTRAVLDGRAARLTTGAASTFSRTGGPSGVPSKVTVSSTLASGFLYVPGTSKLAQSPTDCSTATPIVDPTSTTLNDGRLKLTWSIDTIVGNSYSVCFKTRPGIELGPQAASIDAKPTGSVNASATGGTLTVGDTLEPNDDGGDRLRSCRTTRFYLSYLTSSTDVDYYRFPAPPAGTVLTFHLSHLPADYDLVVYGPPADAASAGRRGRRAARRAAGHRHGRRPDPHAPTRCRRRRSTTCACSPTCRSSASRRTAAPIPRTSSSFRRAAAASTRSRSRATTAPRASNPYMLRAATLRRRARRRTSPRGRSPARPGPRCRPLPNGPQHRLPRQPAAARGPLRLDRRVRRVMTALSNEQHRVQRTSASRTSSSRSTASPPCRRRTPRGTSNPGSPGGGERRRRSDQRCRRYPDPGSAERRRD